MVTVPGRVEARMTVPVGGAAFSASNGAQSAASALTIPAANYYHTAAGGVAGLLATFQQYLNDNVQGYPTTAAAMQSAVGYGTWSAGWLFNITSGNDAGAFGGVTMTPASSPTYGTAGPRGGIDKAIGFDSATDRFEAGDNFDVTATDDLIYAWVGKFSAAQASATIQSKRGGGVGYAIFATGARIQLNTNDGADRDAYTDASLGQLPGEWHVGIAVIDRGAGTMRIGTRGLTSGTAYVGATTSVAGMGTLANVEVFRVGGDAFTGTAPTNMVVSATYVAAGSGVASGLSAGLATALQNFANAVNSSFTVTLGSDGRITISNSFYPSSVAFTNTTLRDVLGFEYDFDYPQTAAQLAAVLGYGTWTTGHGWLLNESSGNFAPIFGSTTLTATSMLYSLLGARGGTDKAVGFDAGTDNASGGDIHDVGATEDLAVVWVSRITATPAAERAIISKFDAGGTIAGWSIQHTNTGVVYIIAFSGGVQQFSTGIDVDALNNEFCVNIAVIDRSTGRARFGSMGLTSGTQLVSTEAAVPAVSFVKDAANFRVGNRSDSGAGAPLETAISAIYVVSGNGVATGLSANLSTALSNFRSSMLSQTGTKHARGVWEPDCTLDLEGDPKRAPLVTDARSTMSPTGDVITYVGNTFKRQRSILWSHVPAPQVWDGEAPYENGSWEEFIIETQFGLGSSWFKPGSLVQIYDHSGTRVGVDADVAGWSIVGINSIEPPKSVPGYIGLWRIELPRIIAVGS